MTRTIKLFPLWTILLVVVGQPVRADDGVDPAAVDILKHSMDFLAGLGKFALTSESSLEVVLADGQKIQYDGAAIATVRRPDRLHVARLGLEQEFFYDGETLTLHDLGGSVYATVDAPDNLEDMLDFAQSKLDIAAPAGELLYSDAFDMLMQDVQSGFVVGTAFIAGVPCDQLAFSAPGTDWQIWIEQGDRPLPRKFVITSRDVLNAPEFSTVVREWDLDPEADDSVFEFEPPDGATLIEFVGDVDAN